jgi:hypothetical protein
MDKSVKRKLEDFCTNINLTKKQRIDLFGIIKEISGVEDLQALTFKDYIIHLTTYFFFENLKKDNLYQQMKEFIDKFFVLLYPTLNVNDIRYNIVYDKSKIDIFPMNEFTERMFETIINCKRIIEE